MGYKYVALLLLIGCATQQPPPHGPMTSVFQAEDVTKVVPPVTPMPAIEGSEFPTLQFDKLNVCDPGTNVSQDCKPIGPGFVISEQTYLKAITFAIQTDRLSKETAALYSLRDREHAAFSKVEQAYQLRVNGLEDEVFNAKQQSLWDRYKGFIGFGIGAALTTAIVLGVSHH